MKSIVNFSKLDEFLAIASQTIALHYTIQKSLNYSIIFFCVGRFYE